MAAGNWAPSLLNLVAGIAALISVRRVNSGLFEATSLEETGVVSALKRGLAVLWERRFLRAVVTLCMATNFLFQIVILLFIVLAKEQQKSTLFIGVILAVSGLGGLAAPLSAPSPPSGSSTRAAPPRPRVLVRGMAGADRCDRVLHPPRHHGGRMGRDRFRRRERERRAQSLPGVGDRPEAPGPRREREQLHQPQFGRGRALCAATSLRTWGRNGPRTSSSA